MNANIKLGYKHITALYGDYDVFLFDLWGVILDGEGVYPNVVPLINDLIKHKQVFFVSNVPRPNHIILDMLHGLGLVGVTQKAIVTSGDITRALVLQLKASMGLGDGMRVFHLEESANSDLLAGIPCDKVDNIEKADLFVLSLHMDEDEDANQFDKLLQTAASIKLKTLCANPDLVFLEHGKLRYCTGYFAKKFENYGGTVTYLGKPYTNIYECAFSKVGTVPKHKILMVGDTLETDILGATNSGIHSALVLTGNSRAYHGKTEDLQEKLQLITQEAKKSNIYPTVVTSLTTGA